MKSKTKKMATQKKTGDRLISTLKKSISELEEFQVQFALGKSEAADVFEEVKKKFHKTIHNGKLKLIAGKKKITDLRPEFDELKLQLALGKADSKEAFNEQKKKIFTAISKLEKSFQNKSKSPVAEVEEKMRHEIEKFRVKVEILRVQFELGKLNAKEDFEKRKQELAHSIAKLKARFEAGKKAAVSRRIERHLEIKEAYKHMKKAFVKA